MADPTYIVRFVELTPHEVHVPASDGAEAINIAGRMLKNLSTVERAKTFLALKTTHEHFTAEPLEKCYRITLEARAIYEGTISAPTATEAEHRAELLWHDTGPEAFEFEDFMDLRVDAEEVM